MTDFDLKRGETRRVTLSLFASGGGAFNLTGYTVTFVVEGVGLRVSKAVTVDTPATLGTGFFDFLLTDYTSLKPTVTSSGRKSEPYRFEIWASDGTNHVPMRSGTFDVIDVPQRA
jgi:hypothetical protein